LINSIARKLSITSFPFKYESIELAPTPHCNRVGVNHTFINVLPLLRNKLSTKNITLYFSQGDYILKINIFKIMGLKIGERCCRRVGGE